MVCINYNTVVPLTIVNIVHMLNKEKFLIPKTSNISAVLHRSHQKTLLQVRIIITFLIACFSFHRGYNYSVHTYINHDTIAQP